MEVTAPPAPCVRAPSTAAAAMRPPLGPRMGGCANSASSLDTKPSGNLYSFALFTLYHIKSQRTLAPDRAQRPTHFQRSRSRLSRLSRKRPMTAPRKLAR